MPILYPARLQEGVRPNSLKVGEFHYNARNILGIRFGKLEVIAEHGRNKKRMLTWLCRCDCGTEIVRVGSSLISGKTTSCGCSKFTPEMIAKRALAQRKPHAAQRHQYFRYKAVARSRGIEFGLTMADVVALSEGDCYYCGDAPSQRKKTKYDLFIANGIDRVDSSKGYLKDNCVSCCFRCNHMKKNWTYGEFIELVCKIAVRHGGSSCLRPV